MPLWLRGLRRLQLPLLLIFFLLIPSVLFLFRVRNREVYFTNRDLRLLALMGDQLTVTLDNFGSMVKNAAAQAEDRSNRVELGPGRTRTLLRSPASRSSSKSAPEPTLARKRRDGELAVKFQGYELTIQLEPLIAPLNRSRVFDEVVLADTDGSVIAQLGVSGMRILNIKDLILHSSGQSGNRAAGASTERGASSHFGDHSDVTDVEVGHTPYKVFLQPVRLSLVRDDTNQNAQFVLCGFVGAVRFSSDTVSIPYVFIIWGVVLVGIGFLSLPFLKMLFMSPHESFRFTDGCLVGLFTLVGSSLVALLFLDTYCLWALDRATDEQLRSIANKIDSNLDQEMVAMHRQLASMSAASQFQEDLLRVRGDASARLARTQYLQHLESNDSAPYPYLTMAVWVDDTGQQRIKWTIANSETPLISIADRPEFIVADKGQFWRHQSGQKSTFDFWMGPVYSPNTGEYLAVLAERSPTSASPLHSGYLVSRPVALFDPILPAGTGYALLDAGGKVVFHADETHNLREDFIEECDQDLSLQAAIFGHGDAFVSASYQGKEQRLFVTKLRSADVAPWTLVVFRDRALTETANLLAFTLAGLLFLCYVALASACVLILYLVWRPVYPAPWVWPRFEYAAEYRQLVLGLLILAIVFAAWVFASGPAESLGAILALPAFALALGIWRLKYAPERSKQTALQKLRARRLKAAAGVVVALALGALQLRQGAGNLWKLLLLTAGLAACVYCVNSKRIFRWCAALDKPSWRHSYTLVNTLFIVVTGILPCFTCFKLAWSKETVLLAEYQQKKLAQDLGERESRIKAAYREILVGEDNRKKQSFLADRCAVERDHGDAYYSAFFSTLAVSDSLGPCAHPTPATLDRGENPLTWQRLSGWLMLPYNSLAVDFRGLNAGDQTQWVWTRDGANRIKLLLHKYSGDRHLQLSSLIPAVNSYTDGGVWLGLLVLSVGVFGLASLVEKKAYFLEVHEPAGTKVLDLPETVKSNLLVLGRAATGKSAHLLDRPDVCVIDLTQEACKENWAHEFNYASLPCDDKVIAIDNFEYKMQEPNATGEKLYFLEQLVHQRHRKVMVVSTVSPLYYLSAGGSGRGAQPDGAEMDRWAGVLGSFTKLIVDEEVCFKTETAVSEFKAALRGLAARPGPGEVGELAQWFELEIRQAEQLQRIGAEITATVAQIRAKLPEGTAITPAVLTREFAEHADAYYGVLWANCSRDEKLALVHLAENGLISPKDQAGIQELLRKHLIVREPVFQIMNGSFREYLLSKINRDEVRRWELEERRAGWGGRSYVVLALLIGASVPLVIAQREALLDWMPSLTPVAGALAGVYRFLRGFLGEAGRDAN